MQAQRLIDQYGKNEDEENDEIFDDEEGGAETAEEAKSSITEEYKLFEVV